MPYITQEMRPSMDEVVDLMYNNNVKANGDLNYVLFKFCKYYITPSYNNYKNFCGELRQCATEIERVLLGPYEYTKQKENGKV